MCPRSAETPRRRSPLSLWIGLALLAVFTTLGIGDPATATADTAVAAAGAIDGPLGFFDGGPRPNLLMMLGLIGLLIFPDKIAPGASIRRDPSSR